MGLLMMAGVINPRAVPIAVGGTLFDQIFDVLDNLGGPE